MRNGTALSVLGLCKKAGKLTVGTPLVCKLISSKRPPTLAIVSAFASENTKKRLYDKCSFYNKREPAKLLARIRVLIDIIIAGSLNMMGIMTLVFFGTLLFILHLYGSYVLKSTESVIFKLIMQI